MADTTTTVRGEEGIEKKKRGAFIVLEGLDRSGKTTQVKLLQTRFVEAGKEVRVMRFPGTFFSSPFLLYNFGWVGGNSFWGNRCYGRL